MIVAVYILYLTRTLGFTPTLLGAVLVAGGVGSVLGSVVAGRLVERIGIGPVLIGSQALTGIARLLIPLADGPLLVVVALLGVSEFLLGAMRAIFNITQISLRQAVIETPTKGASTPRSRFCSGPSRRSARSRAAIWATRSG